MPSAESRALELENARNYLLALPRLSASDIPQDESCPICLMPFTSVLEEAANEIKAAPNAQLPARELGVTKLNGCGHMFCRRDIAEWIETSHGNCPTCRHVFLAITPYSESDYESSDGGEYIPNDEDDEGEDTDDIIDTDGFPSSDIDIDADDELGTEDWEALGIEFHGVIERLMDTDGWDTFGDPALEFGMYEQTTSELTPDIDTADHAFHHVASAMDEGMDDAHLGHTQDDDEDEDDPDYVPAPMSESESSAGEMTDGFDTASSEGDTSGLTTFVDDNDEYAGDISMTSCDEDDNFPCALDFKEDEQHSPF